MLSASDAGRIGRLVLPKKCAEVSSQFLVSIGVFFFGSFEVAIVFQCLKETLFIVLDKVVKKLVSIFLYSC